MSFFEDIDNLRLLERHVARVEGLESSQIKRLIKLYRQAQTQLMSQLLAIPDNTFTEAKLGVALEQTNIMITILEQRLNSELEFGFENLTEQGIEDSVKEINKLEASFTGVKNQVPLEVIINSTDPSTFLFNKYETSIQTYNNSMRQSLQNFLTQGLLQNKSWSQTVNEMGMVMKQNEWKLARIVRTELHQVYNVSKNNGFAEIQEQYIPDLKKTLYHPIDNRTGTDSKTAAAKNLIVDINKPFVYTFIQGDKKVKREFFTPPDRPNDRAILIPYRDRYDN